MEDRRGSEEQRAALLNSGQLDDSPIKSLTAHSMLLGRDWRERTRQPKTLLEQAGEKNQKHQETEGCEAAAAGSS